MSTSAKVLAFVGAYIDEFGYGPTVQEIGDAVGLSSKASVHYHLERLRGSGHVTWVDGQNRTLRVVQPDPDPQDDAYVRLPRPLRDRLLVRARLLGVSESDLVQLVLDALDRAPTTTGGRARG